MVSETEGKYSQLFLLILLLSRSLTVMTYCYRNYIKLIIEKFPISHAYDVAKEDWLVGRSTSHFPPLLFQWQYCSFPNTRTVIQLYSFRKITLYILQTQAFFDSLTIWDTYRLVNYFFSPGRPVNVNEMGNIFNDCQLLPLILPSTIFIALPLFLNQHCCLF